MEISEYTCIVGERIQEWIVQSLTFKNNCKRLPDEHDCFDEDSVAWVFTQKGQRLYESYLSKAQRLIELKYPDELYEDIEYHTGVKYP